MEKLAYLYLNNNNNNNNCSGAEVEEFGRPRTSQMSSSRFSVLGRGRNTSASTRIFSVALISNGRRGVDLPTLNLDLAALEVIGSGFGPIEMDHLYKSSVIGFMTCLTDHWFSKSSSDELFWAELMAGRITAPKLDLIGIGKLSF
ncbi:hypothetical protein PIB30_010069 [Stylosanthes scabra]|uniref:Uncharacterized protein n=1 Tax=Stylosanthes scabra TaxID=79078 RepID=A0ABU6X2R4_9FABA|nr:hypothetical protein [Stylosanthes scabra]